MKAIRTWTLLLISATGACAHAADQYFAGDGSSLGSNKWSSSPDGPFTSSFTFGSVANFATPDGTGTGGNITVGGIKATENFTITAASGTILNSPKIVSINVVSGKTLDFAGQAFTNVSTAGYKKDGDGVLALAGGSVGWGGGFTLNAGTVIARGVNAMGGGNTGSGAVNTLTINGGTIAADANRDFSGKYNGQIFIGGDFTFGATTGLANPAANLTFNNIMNLGAVTRTITIGGNGVYTLAGQVVGTSSQGLTINATGTGTVVLASNGNAYYGTTTILAGALKLSSSQSPDNIAGSPKIVVAGGATFDVSGITKVGGFTLASQTLAGSGTVVGRFSTHPTAATTIAPGDTGSAGALTFASGFTLSSAATVQIELGGHLVAGVDYDQLVVGPSATSVNLNGATLRLLHLGAYRPDQNGRTYTIVDNRSNQSITGNFAGLLDGASFQVDDQWYQIHYNVGADGNDVVIQSVPEPATTFTLLSILGVLLPRRKHGWRAIL